MSTNYSEIFEIKKSRKKTKIFFITIIIVLLIASVVYLINRVMRSSVSSKFDIYVPSTSFFAVTVASSENIDELQAMYPKATAIGASGYVWQGEDMSYMLALIYPTEDMAKSVVASNQYSDFSLDILRLEKKEVAYVLDDFSANDIQIVQGFNDYIVDMANILYELTIAVHIGNISSIACASTINNHKGDMLVKQGQIADILDRHDDANVQTLHSKSVMLINILDKIVNELLSSNSIDNVMKYNLCEYVFELCK